MNVFSYYSLTLVCFTFHFWKDKKQSIDRCIHTGIFPALCNIPRFSCCAEPFYYGKFSGGGSVDFIDFSASFNVQMIILNKEVDLHVDVCVFYINLGAVFYKLQEIVLIVKHFAVTANIISGTICVHLLFSEPNVLYLIVQLMVKLL